MRCNVGINPDLLPDQHLVAEYVEIPMVVGSLRVNNWKIKSSIPDQFKLGTGHMNFLKNKLVYLEKRHDCIKLEMSKRKFNQTKLFLDVTLYPNELCNDWHPTLEDSMVIRKRLSEKLQNPKRLGWWRKNRKNLTKHETDELIEKIIISELFEV